LSANKEAAVVDVRTTKEYSKGHLEGAMHIPLDDLRGRTEEVPADGPVLIYCQSGHRSYIAQQMLVNLGRTDVLNLIGGYGLFVQHRRNKVE
jgi:rhodanese-related sulfurtransferase